MDLSIFKNARAKPVPRPAPASGAAALPDPLAPTIFHEAWWLDASAPDGWSETLVRADNRIVGRLPYMILRKPFGQTSCEMPKFAHFLGPAVAPGPGARANRALKEAQIVRELHEQLPPTGNLYMRMHRGVTDTMVHAEAGLHMLVNFTFEIAPGCEQAIWAGMRDKTRNIIRRAQEKHCVSDTLDPRDFAACYRRNVDEAGHESYYETDEIVRVCTAALERGRGRILAATGPDGSLAAAIFTIWDATSCYYLLATRTRGEDHGATSLLLWEAIRHANRMGLIFDFDGLYTRGNRVFFTGFGGTVHPRYVVCGSTRTYRATAALSKALGRLRRS
ncbi:GNAT family N-acetyltransferase [Rhodobacter sphaeroides]|uniref:GNAT family N-acetyltransferase n=1 Tax=Cereibacter sphaeroides TaxID=1063 RepID=UPI001323EAAE|nr:GNAT family N-acetyltransferase [Cereibacter sphaeroides]MWP37877.1 GNAT family N-acetyltransferase [Cereibacter sphaeroides]